MGWPPVSLAGKEDTEAGADNERDQADDHDNDHRHPATCRDSRNQRLCRGNNCLDRCDSSLYNRLCRYNCRFRGGSRCLCCRLCSLRRCLCGFLCRLCCLLRGLDGGFAVFCAVLMDFCAVFIVPFAPLAVAFPVERAVCLTVRSVCLAVLTVCFPACCVLRTVRFVCPRAEREKRLPFALRQTAVYRRLCCFFDLTMLPVGFLALVHRFLCAGGNGASVSSATSCAAY